MGDFITDANDDLVIVNGDFLVDESLEQEIAYIVKSNVGEWKQNPTIGFGIAKRMRTVQTVDDFKQELDIHLKLDNLIDTKIKLSTEGQLTISAKRNE